VLDIGCGAGAVTRAAARAATAGSALGVDLSSSLLGLARQESLAEGLSNVDFVQADAQTYAFSRHSFDLAVSRFGVMFFADRVAAFANIRAALRPAGRLVVVAWRGIEANEWLSSLFGALAVGRDLPRPQAGATGPLGLADPSVTRTALTAAGFESVELTALDEPWWAGHDVEDAYGWLRTNGLVRGLTETLDDATRQRALDNLQATLTAHLDADGVNFRSGAWLITATAP
jgi:SAM-dependent methyltransferase